jgi:hypothetical protein
MSDRTGNKTNYLIAAVLVAIWGILGVMDRSNVPYSGYFTDGNNTVTQVLDASPAQMAGLQTGDVITSTGGIAVSDVRAATERGRASIGETRAFVVDRGGQAATVDLQYAAVPSTQALVGHLGSLIGLSFIFFGLWVFRKMPNATTGSLAWFGVCFGATFMAAPYFSSAVVRTATGVVVTIAVVLGFALLLDFLRQTGSDEAFTDQKSTSNRIFWPAIGVAALLAMLAIVQPTATSGLNVAVRLIVGLFVVGYLGGSLLQVFRNYTGADAATRESRGLGMMLAGAVVGLGPVVSVSLITLVSPSTVIPTSQYWFLTLAAIPATFAIAAMQASEAVLTGRAAATSNAAQAKTAAPIVPVPESSEPAPPPATEPSAPPNPPVPEPIVHAAPPVPESIVHAPPPVPESIVHAPAPEPTHTMSVGGPDKVEAVEEVEEEGSMEDADSPDDEKTDA